jgi:uncharacterized membrane-anchored protein YjiN (DUF445 family)
METTQQRAPVVLTDAERQDRLTAMKRTATGLLIAVTLIFAVATPFAERYVLVGFVAAFAEAAMVGALADWFAVTALFRHPLGLRIPHTAIIPQGKDRLGQALGRFVQQNFLNEEVIALRVRSLDVAQRVGEWLCNPRQSGRVASTVADVLGGMGQVVRDDDIQHLIERGIVERVERIPVTPLAGRLLAAVASDERRQDLLFALVQLARQLLEENKGLIREAVSREMPRITFGLLDDAMFRRIVGPIEQALDQVHSDPNHALRGEFNARLAQIIEDLQHDEAMIARGEELKREVLRQPVVRELASSIWSDVKGALLAPPSHESVDDTPIQRALFAVGQALLNDDALRAKVNQWAEQAARYTAREYGSEVSTLITHTVERWDAEGTARKLELQVGRDLQFIRINGTIVGGLVGLLIHAFTLLLR